MTVTAGTSNRVQENGNGVKVAFGFSFRIFDQAEIEVNLVNLTTLAQVLQVITTDYSVAINGIDNALTTPGGTVTWIVPPPTGEASLLISDYNIDQETEFPVAGNLPEVAFEDGLDKGVLIAIQQQEELGRTAKVPSASTITDLELPLPTANKALLWNATADDLINSTDDFNDIVTDAAASETAAAASAASASTSETNAATSATNAATDAALAQAAVGGVRISADDTTADNLETKLLVGDALALSTQNPAGNETRTIDIDINSLSTVTITMTDEIMYADVSDSNNLKKTTAQGIVNLVPAATTSVAGIVELATQAEMEAETASKVPTADIINFNPGVAKGWAAWDASSGTPTIEVSHNVTSLTDDATGIVTVNWDTDFSGADYAVQGTTESTGIGTDRSIVGIASRAAGSVTLHIKNVNATIVGQDENINCVTAFGDQ